MSVNSSPDDNSIDFEKVSVEDAAKTESPAEHAKRMEELSKKFDLQPKLEDVKSESTNEEPKTLISSYNAAINRYGLEPNNDSIALNEKKDTEVVEQDVEMVVQIDENFEEQTKGEIENSKKVESSKNFDEVFSFLDSLDGYVSLENGGLASVEYVKAIIKEYLSGEKPIYVKDMLDSLKNRNDGSDALKGVPEKYGLRKKVYELLRKESSVNYITLKGEVKHAGEKSESFDEVNNNEVVLNELEKELEDEARKNIDSLHNSGLLKKFGLSDNLYLEKGDDLVYDINGRKIVLVDMNGVSVPFYCSLQGTGGKKGGEWYPFFGFANAFHKGEVVPNWFIKGKNLDVMDDGYGVQDIKTIMEKLNTSLGSFRNLNNLGKVDSKKEEEFISRLNSLIETTPSPADPRLFGVWRQNVIDTLLRKVIDKEKEKIS